MPLSALIVATLIRRAFPAINTSSLVEAQSPTTREEMITSIIIVTAKVKPFLKDSPECL
jgi:hypothetical protein